MRHTVSIYSLVGSMSVNVQSIGHCLCWTSRGSPNSCIVTKHHYDDVIMDVIASQITNLTIVYSTVYSGVDQSKHQSSASLAFVWGIHRGPVNSPHKWPVTRKMFPFADVIMWLVMWHAWWRHQMETFSASLVLCAGNSLVTGEFPSQWPLRGSSDGFFDLRLNKQLGKQSEGGWFGTQWR